jgi:hypothetical protein
LADLLRFLFVKGNAYRDSIDRLKRIPARYFPEEHHWYAKNQFVYIFLSPRFVCTTLVTRMAERSVLSSPFGMEGSSRMVMTDSILASIAKWESFLIVGSLIAIIAVDLLTGKIDMHFLFYGLRGDGSRYFSPGRVQLLVATISVACQYLINASQAQFGSMPGLPAGALELLGASNALYLGGNAITAFWKTTAGGF